MSSSMYARDPSEVAAALSVDPKRGLPASEAVRRSVHFGRNVIKGTGRWALWAAIASLFARRPRPVVAHVLSDGAELVINAADLVPGDVIVIDSGADVPADARIVTAAALTVDETDLTGESVPVAKSPDAVSDDAPLSKRQSMLYLGTHVVAGHATAIVTATGDATELGKLCTAA